MRYTYYGVAAMAKLLFAARDALATLAVVVAADGKPVAEVALPLSPLSVLCCVFSFNHSTTALII